MGLLDINKVVEKLKLSRSVFHSEADLQFSFALAIKEIYKEKVKVRMEYPLLFEAKKVHVDIVVFIDNKFIPIELKYKTKSTDEPLMVDGESYYLENQGAQDLGKFDYLADIERIELYKNQVGGFYEGYAIFITNDQSYTKNTLRETRNKQFSLGNGLIKSGNMKWREDSSIFTKKHRKEYIEFENEYTLAWDIFTDLNQGLNSKFYILVNSIK